MAQKNFINQDPSVSTARSGSLSFFPNEKKIQGCKVSFSGELYFCESWISYWERHSDMTSPYI